jgi:hypothetical protein
MLQHTIDRDLKKYLSIYQFGVECDWFHVAKENIEVSLFERIKESAVSIEGGELLSMQFFDKSTVSGVKDMLGDNCFGILTGDTICDFYLDISSNYKIALVDSKDFENAEGNIDKHLVERSLKTNLFSDCHIYLDKKVGFCCGYKDLDNIYQKTSLNSQKASFGMTKFGSYRALMSISTVLSSDKEEVSVKFIPQKILNRDILIVWKTSL